MNEFLLTIFNFPTVVFTILLGISILYWICASFGLFEVDVLDVDLSHLDGHMSLNSHSDHSFGETFAGLLMRLGLNGVPVTIVISLIALFGWLLSYYASYFFLALFGFGWLRFIVGIPILLAAFYVAVLITAQVIKPLRKLFAKTEQNIQKKVLGQTATVRSSRVDSSFGEANLDDGGAGLILKVRATGDQVFERGDKVVLLEYIANINVYRVVSEAEFLGLTSE